MTFLKSALSHLSHKSASNPVVVSSMSLDSWCHQPRTQPIRLVSKIEICTALAAGDDAWGTPVDNSHLHTLLRVSLLPTSTGFAGEKDDVLFIERVLSTEGSYHSVTPTIEVFSTTGTLFHPEVHDRICVISDGASSILASHLEVERTFEYGNGAQGCRLTLCEFVQTLALVSTTTKLICAGGDCKFQSRSFAFACMAALTPSLPPPVLIRKAGEGVGMNVRHGTDFMGDSVFEAAAEMFLEQVPWLVGDAASQQAVELMLALRNDFRERGQ